MQFVKDCMICGERFITLKEYDNHKPIHDEVIIQDLSLNKLTQENQNQSEGDTFKSDRKTLSKLQITKNHTGENSFQCNICSKKYSNFT